MIVDPLAQFRLDDRAVVLTGASSGLGLGFAHALGAVGAKLVLAARRQPELDALVTELHKGGVDAVALAVDISAPENCRAVADLAVKTFGRIDVLVNNAGTASATPAHREAPETFRRVIEVNLCASFWMAQACARHMPDGSSIVNVSSALGHVAPRFPNAAYAASKAGVLGLTRDLAQEWTGRRGIRVNALCPGYFDSEMTADGRTAIEEMLERHSVMPRFGVQRELDSALIFLASDASSYVTGASILVDGGLSAM